MEVSYLATNLESAGEFFEIDVGDALHTARLLDVGAVCADR